MDQIQIFLSNLLSFKARIIILTLLAILAGSIFIFFNFFYFGKAIFNSEFAFDYYNLDGIRGSCPAGVCEMNLKPQTTKLIIRSAGFQEQTIDLSIEFNQTTEINLSFQEPAQVKLIGVWNPLKINFSDQLIRENLNQLPLNLSSQFWNQLASLIQNKSQKTLLISPNLQFAIVNGETNYQIVNLNQNNQTNKLPIPNDRPIKFSADSSKIYHLSFDGISNRYLLSYTDLSTLNNQEASPQTDKVRRNNLKTLTQQNLITLAQDLPNADISVNPSEEKVIITDQIQNVYLFNLKEKTRLKLGEIDFPKQIIWLNDEEFILINYPKNQNQPNYHLFNFEQTFPGTQLSLSQLPNLIEILPNQQILTVENLANQEFSLQLFNPKTQISEQIFTVNNLNMPTQIKYSPEDQQIYFISSGNVYSLNLNLN